MPACHVGNQGTFMSSHLSERHLLQCNSGFVLPGKSSLELGMDGRQYMNGRQGKGNLPDAASRVHGCWTGTQAHLPGSAQVPAILITACHLAYLPVTYRLQQASSFPTRKDSCLMWILLSYAWPHMMPMEKAPAWSCRWRLPFNVAGKGLISHQLLSNLQRVNIWAPSLKEKTCGSFPLLSDLELWTDQRSMGWGKQGEAGAGRCPGR